MALKTILERVDPEDMEDDDNADELGESGGMRARPQPRKPSTQEVEIINRFDLGAVIV